MLTHAQMQRCVAAIVTALVNGKHCALECAQERANNLVTALMFPVDDVAAVVATTLRVRAAEISDIDGATKAAHIAFVVGRCGENGERFSRLVRGGMSADGAKHYLAEHGWIGKEACVHA